MPIPFPRPTGIDRFDITQWIKAQATLFGSVPCPIFGNLGGKVDPKWDLEPAKFVQKPVNLRNLGTMYEHGGGNAGPKYNEAKNILTNQLPSNNGYAISAKVAGTKNWRMAGISYNATGVALGTCVVKVYKTPVSDVPNLLDDTIVAPTVISDGSGNWTAYPTTQGPYYLVEYKVGSPDVFGTSPNNLQASPFTPGQ